MARNVKFSFLRGGGSSLEVLYGKVSLTPTNLHTLSSTAVLPAPTTFDLVNGTALATNVAPTPTPVGGTIAWAYKVKITDNFGKSWEYLVGVPDGTTEINFNVLPRYSETRPPAFGVGPAGPAGQSATIAIGSTTSGPTPAVTNTGTTTDAILNFTLAKGDKGDTGAGVPAGGTALQVVRKNVANTATEWATVDNALVGLGNVDNTSDANKPLSTPQKEYVDGRTAPATPLASGTLSAADKSKLDGISEEATDRAVYENVSTPGTDASTFLESTYSRRLGPAQASLYGKFIQKVRSGSSFTITAMGDSITYGQDTTSADRIAPATGTTPDGATHTLQRAPNQYPTVMQDALNVVYGAGKATVNNQGFSGDWAKRGYARWSVPTDADLTIIGYGINDSRAAWSEFPGEIGPFIEWYEKIIVRTLAWGSACMIMLPLRQVSGESANLGAYRTALATLAETYGIPTVDAAAILVSYGAAGYSDDTHLNGKGYNALGYRTALAIIADATSYGGTTRATGAYYLPVPAVYDETTGITETRIKMQSVLDQLGVPSWGNFRGQAPAFKITIRTYEQAVIEYMLSINASPTGGTGTAVEKLVQLRRTNIAATPTEARVREISSVVWDAASKEWVIAWVTAGKTTTINFAVVISLL